MTARARVITFRGKTATLTEWASDTGISKPALINRIRKHGVDRAISGARRRKPQVDDMLIDDVTSYEDDVRCRLIVRHFVGGMTLDQVGMVMAVCRERIRQIEEEALEKLRLGLRIIDAVGEMRAELILRRLRGRGPRHYRQAMHDAKERRL